MMARLRDYRRLDLGLSVAVLVAALAMWPVLTRAGLPQGTDVTAHIYRIFELLGAWRGGVVYPRWTQDFVFGFGYPIFHYYAPLAYYLGAAYSWFLAGGDPVIGLKFVIIMGAGLGTLGMYLFARDLWHSAPAGVVGAAAFGLSPYFVLNGSVMRGAVPETLAVGLAPWLFWASLRLDQTPTPRRVALAALIIACLVLAHNLMPVVFLGLWSAWFTWSLARRRDASHSSQRRILTMLAAAALGLALSAFMWLPAVWERSAVQYERARQWRVFTLDDLFSLPSLVRALSNDDMLDPYRQGLSRTTLGQAQIVLGGLGFLALWRVKTWRKTLSFWALTTLVLIVILNPVSLPAWRAVSWSRFLQFPERLFGALAFALAALSGAAVVGLAQWLNRLKPGPIAALCAAACAVSSLTLLDPPPWLPFPPVTLERLFKLEGGLGFTTGEFLPIGVQVQPQAKTSLLDSYAAGMVDKVDREALPGGAQVAVLAHGPAHDHFHVTSGAPFTLRVLTLAWPGWIAYVNGRLVPIQVVSPEGFIGVPVPAGESDVLLRLEDTPPRRLGWIVSTAAGLIIVGLALNLGKTLNPSPGRPRLERRDALLAIGLLSLTMLARAILDLDHWWSRPWSGQAIPEAQMQLAELESNVDFLAYQLAQAQARPGDALPLTLYWRARALVPLNLRVFVHLIGPDGQLWGQSDKLWPGGTSVWDSGLPTYRWPLDRYFPDPHSVLIKPDAPPGQYQLIAGMWDEITGARLHVLDANGEPTGADGVTLATPFRVQP